MTFILSKRKHCIRFVILQMSPHLNRDFSTVRIDQSAHVNFKGRMPSGKSVVQKVFSRFTSKNVELRPNWSSILAWQKMV